MEVLRDGKTRCHLYRKGKRKEKSTKRRDKKHDATFTLGTCVLWNDYITTLRHVTNLRILDCCTDAPDKDREEVMIFHLKNNNGGRDVA